VVPEKGGRRERCGGRVAVRETELLDKVASKGLLREHDGSSRRRENVHAEIARNGAIVGADEAGEKGTFELLALDVVREREQDVVDVETQVDGVCAVVPVHEALAGVDRLKPVVDEKRPKSICPGARSSRQSVQELAEFPDDARGSAHAWGRPNVDVLVRREVVGL
jgi:hypothetical protein